MEKNITFTFQYATFWLQLSRPLNCSCILALYVLCLIHILPVPIKLLLIVTNLLLLDVHCGDLICVY